MKTTKTLAALAAAALLAVGASACATVEQPTATGKPAADKSKPTGPSAAERAEQRARQQGLRLTSEAGTLVAQITDWSTKGQTNPVQACSTRTVYQRKQDRLERIVRKLEHNSIAKRNMPTQLGALRAQVDSMGDVFTLVKTSCAGMGL